MACKRESRDVYVWSVLALMVVALPLIVWALIDEFFSKLYRCETHSDEGMLVVQHYVEMLGIACEPFRGAASEAPRLHELAADMAEIFGRVGP